MRTAPQIRSASHRLLLIYLGDNRSQTASITAGGRFGFSIKHDLAFGHPARMDLF